MTWTEPEYPRRDVDAAGEVLVDRNASGDAIEDALQVINNWRSAHSFPLNTFQVSLRANARAIEPSSLVAQRLKRLSSIELKLRRFSDWLKLSEMQDIGGCRAVMRSVPRIDELVRRYRTSSMRHRLLDSDDYIRTPKKSGYRGYHLIYEYTSDRKETFNGLKIELQFRSPLQHAWATAVETVGRFTHQALKSSMGAPQWLRFFSLMSSALALREKTPLVPGTPHNQEELVTEITDLASQLEVVKRLEAYRALLRPPEEHRLRGAHYFLVALDPTGGTVKITGFGPQERELAASMYLATERQMAVTPGGDAVLVSVESLAELRRAYPNYFLDTEVFLNAVERVVLPKPRGRNRSSGPR